MGLCRSQWAIMGVWRVGTEQSHGWAGHDCSFGVVWVCLYLWVGELGMVTMDGWYSESVLYLVQWG